MTKLNKYFISSTKTTKENFDFPVSAETPEQAKKIAQEMIDKGFFGTSHFEETDVQIDMIRDENLKSVDLN